MIIVTENAPDLFDQRHGGPFDRGAADSYYNRPMKPHYFIGASYSSEEVTGEKMTKEEVYAYWAGYEWNEQFGCKKEW
jgi:hypothetical protein